MLDLPFDSERKLMTTVIEYKEKYLSITKGAPDVVFKITANSEILSQMIEVNKKTWLMRHLEY